MKRIIRQKVKRWLSRRGIIINRVKYRVEVPQEPLAVQKVLMERLGITRPVIFDIGANRGKLTARYRELFPQAEIYSFEPFPAMVEILVKRFAGDKGIHVVPLAVSEREGTADLHLTGLDTTNSLQRRQTQSRRYYPEKALSTGQAMGVPVTTLDTFCRAQGIERVDILKFDIQGGEMMALRGATEVLCDKGVKLILTESALIQHYEQEALLHEVTGLLADFRFSLYDLYHLYRGRNGQLRYCDAIFVSQALRQSALDTFPEEP